MKRAFTLIELLVVIAIIAILLAILVPGLNVAKEQAASIPCSSNIRQLATAWYLYQQDFNGRFPGGDAWWHGANGVWYPWAEPPTGASAAGDPASLVSEQEGIQRGSLWAYTENLKAYHCPADKRSAQAYIGYRSYSVAGVGSSPHNPFLSSATNLNPPPGAPCPTSGWNYCGWSCMFRVLLTYNQIKSPSSKYVFVEEKRLNGGKPYWNDGTWVMNIRGHNWHDPVADWHAWGGTFGYADGHAERIKWKDERTRAWVQKGSYNPPAADHVDNPDKDLMLLQYPQ